jgi:hypothetical protein
LVAILTACTARQCPHFLFFISACHHPHTLHCSACCCPHFMFVFLPATSPTVRTVPHATFPPSWSSFLPTTIFTAFTALATKAILVEMDPVLDWIQINIRPFTVDFEFIYLFNKLLDTFDIPSQRVRKYDINTSISDVIARSK